MRRMRDVGAVVAIFAFLTAILWLRLILRPPWTFARAERALVIAVVVTCGVMAVGFGLRVHHVRAVRAAARWGSQEGFVAVEDRHQWPWVTDEPGVPLPVVNQAYAGSVDGFPVTVGHAQWESSGMLDVAGAAKGGGCFAILKLPYPSPRLGVRAKLNVTGDEFARQFWTICDDPAFAMAHIGPALRSEHVAGTLPDWMLVGDELYVVIRGRAPITPADIRYAIGKVRRIGDLLGLTSD